MLVREEVRMVPGPVGDLEARYLTNENAQGVALLCHPNPAQGGTMLNKVISTMQRTARDQGLATLRFNYRGTGNSAGVHDMESGEVDDAEAMLDWLRQQHPDVPIYLFGFSFGGFVAASLTGRLQQRGVSVEHLCMAAPSVTRLYTPFVPNAGGQVTIIQPEEDEIVEPEVVYQWAQELGLNYRLFRVPHCGHFFHGKLVELKQIILQHVFAVQV